MYRKRRLFALLPLALLLCLMSCQPVEKRTPEWSTWTLSEEADSQAECIVYPEGRDESVLHALWGIVLGLYE
jgi:hypothetical protein